MAMNKEVMKQDMMDAYEKTLDALLSQLSDEDDFVSLEQKMLCHLEKTGQESYELVQKHKSFSP